MYVCRNYISIEAHEKNIAEDIDFLNKNILQKLYLFIWIGFLENIYLSIESDAMENRTIEINKYFK